MITGEPPSTTQWAFAEGDALMKTSGGSSIMRRSQASRTTRWISGINASVTRTWLDRS